MQTLFADIGEFWCPRAVTSLFQPLTSTAGEALLQDGSFPSLLYLLSLVDALWVDLSTNDAGLGSTSFIYALVCLPFVCSIFHECRAVDTSHTLLLFSFLL